MEIDEGFIKRVYRTSIFVLGFGLLACWSTWGGWAALGWTIGGAMSIGLLRALEWAVRRTFVPGATDAREFMRFSLFMMPVVLLILGLVVWAGRSHKALLYAFCGGIILTAAVISLKVLGMLINRRLNKD